MIASEVHGCMLVHDYGKRQVLDDRSGLGFL